jgi:hypothetical protein
VLFERDVMRGDGDLRARVNAWMPVMAGARLAEGQSGERDALLRVIVRTLG